MQINDPAVIAELTRCHEVYEKALIDNDVATLDGFFWDSPHAIRLGVAENLHGTDEIRAFRKGRPNINLAREILRLDIMALGDSTGVINLEFLRPMNGIDRYGRQTQFWFKFPEGWKIASAHVSLMPLKTLPAQAAYLQAASAEIGLAIDAGHFVGAVEDLSRIAAIAEFVTQFPLSQSVEAAPVFQP